MTLKTDDELTAFAKYMDGTAMPAIVEILKVMSAPPFTLSKEHAFATLMMGIIELMKNDDLDEDDVSRCYGTAHNHIFKGGMQVTTIEMTQDVTSAMKHVLDVLLRGGANRETPPPADGNKPDGSGQDER